MMSAMNLIDETYALLDANAARSLPERWTYTEIAIGARVDRNWLIKFALRKIKSPGASKVQNVYDFMSTGHKVATRPVRIRSQTRPRRLREVANA
jgi:hypothetical protein